MRGGPQAAPRREHTACSAACTRMGYTGERAGSYSVSPRAHCKPPAPAHSLPPARLGPHDGPLQVEPWLRDRLQRQSGAGVVVSLKPCSYGAAPHRDQRAQPCHCHSQGGRYREQARAKYRHKQQPSKEAPLAAPSQLTPSWGSSHWDHCPWAPKRRDLRFFVFL